MSQPTGDHRTTRAGAPLLSIRGLRTEIRLRHSTVHAVDGVDLTVAAGETLGIVGESGCGKTMTALSIMRLLPPGGSIVDGSIELEGRDLSALSESELRRVRGNEIGMVFQDPLTSLNPTMTVGDQIAETVVLHRDVSHDAARRRAVEVLDLVGIARPRDRLREYPHQFSGGMRQRVMIAIALACEPKLLIADEPTTALDVTIQAQILELVDRLRKELGMAVLLVTHDLGVIAGRADRVAVMYAGRVVETATAVQLFDQPRHRYTEALFSALPENVVETHHKLYSIPGLPPDLADPTDGCRFAPRCRFAQADCKQTDVNLVADEHGHSYACLHPVLVDTTDDAKVLPLEVRQRRWRLDFDSAEGAGATVASTRQPLLEVSGLVKDFPLTRGLLQRTVGAVSAVADVTFSVDRGRTFGLVGESGCGKTTLGRLVVALEHPTSGRVRVNGSDLFALRGRRLRDERRNVQFMFQDPYSSLDPRMRVGSILREPLQVQKLGSAKQQRARVRTLLDNVGLPAGAVERYPHEFSGGQRQRLGLARALALDPKLVVADEPVSALDVSIQAQILNMMRDLQDDFDLTYVVISHDLSVIRYLSDTIGVMYLGKMVEIGPSADVATHPLHPYTHGLIEAVPKADPRSEQGRGHQIVKGELPSAIDPPSGCRFRTRCPLADDICAEQEPPLRELRPGHRVACHFPLESGVPRPPGGATVIELQQT